MPSITISMTLFVLTLLFSSLSEASDCKIPTRLNLSCSSVYRNDVYVGDVVTFYLSGVGKRCSLPEPDLEISGQDIKIKPYKGPIRSRGEVTWVFSVPKNAYYPEGGNLVTVRLGKVSLITTVAFSGSIGSYSCLNDVFFSKP